MASESGYQLLSWIIYVVVGLTNGDEVPGKKFSDSC